MNKVSLIVLYIFKNFFVINLFPNKPKFLPVCSTNLLKTLRKKEKLLVMSNFSFSHSVFYPFEKLSAIFIQFEIVVCKLFQFGRVYNFVVWERVKKYKFVCFMDTFCKIYGIIIAPSPSILSI